MKKLETIQDARNTEARESLPSNDSSIVDNTGRKSRLDNNILLLTRYAQAYTMCESIATDSAYDELLSYSEKEAEELQTLIPRCCYFGEVIPQSKKIKHKCTIGSMKKLKSVGEALKYMRTHGLDTHAEFDIDYKLDGISCILYYDFTTRSTIGCLESVSTRGDGQYGTNITSKFSLISGSNASEWVWFNKNHIGSNHNVVGVRGELVISFDNFEVVNKLLSTMGLRQYKTPRSMVAGLISNDGLTPAQQVELYRYITFFAFDVLYKDDAPDELKYTRAPMFHGGRMFNGGVEALTPPITPIKPTNSVEQLKSIILEADKLRYNDGCRYPTDGLVLRIEGQPPMAIKLPNPDNKATSTILEIEYFTGDTGKETPVATVTPVEILGKTISRVNLHNRKYISEKAIEVGSVVELTLAGEIIPQVVKVVT